MENQGSRRLTHLTWQILTYPNLGEDGEPEFSKANSWFLKANPCQQKGKGQEKSTRSPPGVQLKWNIQFFSFVDQILAEPSLAGN